MLHKLVRCRACGESLSFSDDGMRLCCNAPRGSVLRGGFLIHDPAQDDAASPEMLVRDADALDYLSHPKFPTQIDRLKRFLRQTAAKERGGAVLDLGCGPGPTTELLLEAGYDIVAIDFSIQSLAINAHLCGAEEHRALFVQADMNAVEFVDQGFDGLMIADVLQHIGDREKQAAFLRKVFRALKPGGWFYLSFFNTNLLDRLKGDVEGTRGNIYYCRSSPSEIRGMLPDGIVAERESVMNIFNGAGLDRLAARLPFARHLARMAVVEGRRTV